MVNRLHAARWTYADYLRLPDDGTRCEIIEGERLMTPSPFTRHQAVSFMLERLLGDFVLPRGLGSIYHAPCDVILADNTVVQPDILFVSKARESIIEEQGIFGPPDLVIEILSKADPRRDTVRKLAIYARHGIREYWIVDPDADRIDVFVLDGKDLVKKAAHDRGEARSLAVLPGFAAPLSEVFARPL
jgi:Uma2 family endonuclease